MFRKGRFHKMTVDKATYNTRKLPGRNHSDLLQMLFLLKDIPWRLLYTPVSLSHSLLEKDRKRWQKDRHSNPVFGGGGGFFI